MVGWVGAGRSRRLLNLPLSVGRNQPICTRLSSSCGIPAQGDVCGTSAGVEVQAPGHRLTISTTGEFSHRIRAAGLDGPARPGASVDAIDPQIAGRYGAPPIVLPHYLPPAAIAQKIGALARRAVNQPRDVFDLDLLVSRHRDAAPRKGDIDSDEAGQAADRAAELDFAAFRDAVLPFIDVAVRPFYETPEAWSAIQKRVLAYLLELV
jgi:Nucleotidyl transferase AbiEii toxin, Type IV TA system